MVDLVEGVLEGGQVLPDPVERGVRSSIFGQTAIALGETGASLGRSVAGDDDAEVTFGATPFGNFRYNTDDGSVEAPGTGGGTGTPISRLAGLVVTNAGAIASGIVVLVAIYVFGNLFTFNFNVGDNTE